MRSIYTVFLIYRSKIVRYIALFISILGIGLKLIVPAAIASPLLLIGLGVLLFFLQAFSAYADKTYEPALIRELWDDFEKIESRREFAAKACLAYLSLPEPRPPWATLIKDNPQCKYMEYVLDIFEDVGFFLRVNKLSDEMAYHYFGHYVIVYWLGGGREYVKERTANERATWRDIKGLYERILIMESIHGGEWPNEREEYYYGKLVEYLEEELDDGMETLKVD